jgi:hypothetical protein
MENTMKTSSPQLLRLVAATLLSCAAGATSAQTLIGSGKNALSFPIVISQPGSYKLAANLVVPANNVTAIKVTAPNVTIDLNGFSISGPNTCNHVTKLCTQPYSDQSAGIYSNAINTTVANGTVSGFSHVGVNLYGVGGTIRNLTAAHNFLAGVAVSDGRIENVMAQFNGAGVLSNGGLVVSSHAAHNIHSGFQMNGSMLIGSTGSSNGGSGAQGNGGASGVRESFFMFNGALPMTGIMSMGNNQCSGAPC